MTVIKGYASRPQPKWPLLLAIVFIALTGIAVLVSLVPPNPNKGAATSSATVEATAMTVPSTITLPPATTSTTLLMTTTTRPRVMDIKLPTVAGGIKVEKIFFSGSIGEYNQPAGELLEINLNETSKIYCFTKISADSVPQLVRHVWVAPSGKIFATVPLNISKPVVDTYSYVSLYGAEQGVWVIRVEDASGKLLAKSNFTAK
ncbi:MAG: DUF2914 domain-containing protein [Candidatus Margulisbacteria bacterium]|nr:DUF2914 domain-containing protein [Candidatus Margulisiibacteriota bacterium]